MERMKRAGKWILRQRWWWPFASLLAMALLFPLFRSPQSRDIRSPQFLAAAKALPAGAAVNFDDFALHTGPPPAFADRFVDDQSLDRLAHTRYKQGLTKGDLLKWEDLESSRPERQIPAGHRAYVILPENPWLAHAGDRIDILVRPHHSGDEPLVLAENVLVLERMGRGTKGEVIVALRQRDLELLEKAKQQGKLSIAVLGKTDFAANRSNSSRRHRRPSRRVRSVEIITGAE